MSSRGQPAPSPPLAGWIPATRRTTAPTSRDPVRVLPRSASDDFSRHRSAQTGPREIAVPEDGSAPPERAVHRTREADHEAAQAVPQRMGVVGLDDEMEMVIL